MRYYTLIAAEKDPNNVVANQWESRTPSSSSIFPQVSPNRIPGLIPTNHLPWSLYWLQLRQTVLLFEAVRRFRSLENAGIPYSKVTKARMLIHPGFPVRMVQWGGKRNSSAPITEQAAWQPHTAQVNLLWPTVFDSFLPSRKRSVSGKDQIPIHLIKDLPRKAKLSETAKRTEHKRPLLEQAPLPPSFLVSQARKSNFLSAGGHQQHDLVRYWDFFTCFCFNSADF